RLVDLVDRAARDIAGIVDEDVDVGGVLCQSRKIGRISEVDDMGGGADLMGGAQPLGQRFQRIAAAGGEKKVAAFLGEGFGRGSADALGGAGDQDALAAQMQIHGNARLLGACRKADHNWYAAAVVVGNIVVQVCATAGYGPLQ